MHGILSFLQLVKDPVHLRYQLLFLGSKVSGRLWKTSENPCFNGKIMENSVENLRKSMF
jgi:hypothetical protein